MMRGTGPVPAAASLASPAGAEPRKDGMSHAAGHLTETLSEDEPMPLRLAAHGVHFALYAAMVPMPITGAPTWWLDIELAAEFHRMGPNIIYAPIAAHVGGAL